MYKDKILLVDDEKVFCDMMKMHLEAIGNFEVAVAYDGKEGMRLARKIKPDAIVLDILMPKMNGLDVLKKLKEDDVTMEIPVIMLTGKDDPSYKEMALQLYDELYLVKPVDARELKAKIDAILKLRPRAD